MASSIMMPDLYGCLDEALEVVFFVFKTNLAEGNLMKRLATNIG